MSRVKEATRLEYSRICHMNPDAEMVRREYRIADAKYREAVSEGNGTPESGAMIAQRIGAREAWAKYAQEKGIEL